jgi:hypothetical protein
MKHWIKTKIRNFAIWLIRKTDIWIVNEDIWRLIDDDEYEEAEKALNRCSIVWPCDPEITYARSICSFMRPMEEEEDD